MRRVCGLVLAIWLVSASPAVAADVAPVSANSLYQSVGVNTHLTFANTAYGDWPRLVGLLDDLGVKHVRDGAYANPSPSWSWFMNYFESRVLLAGSHGIRFDFLMGSPGWDGGSINQLISMLGGPLRGSVEAVEDPNEFDATGGDWASRLVAYDRQLYLAVKANPSLRSVPVVGPSLISGSSVSHVGDQSSWLDRGNVHPYTGGSSPTPEHTDWELHHMSAPVAGRKPTWATEAGYYNAMAAPPRMQPLSEATAAVYLLREYLENFKSGIARTYAYELIDDFPNPAGDDAQQHFGLLRNDYTRKAAFTALRNLLSLVGQESLPTLTPLDITATGPGDLRQLLVQRGPNNYLLLLWRDTNIWDISKRTPLDPPPATVTLSIPNVASVTRADPISTSTPSPLAVRHHQATVALGNHPLAVRISTHASSPTCSGSAATSQSCGPKSPHSGVPMAAGRAIGRTRDRLVRCSRTRSLRRARHGRRVHGGVMRRAACR